MNKSIEQVLSYLTEKRGFDFSGYRPVMLERRINKRVAFTKSTGFREYLDYLYNHPNEIDHLLDVLTINVSKFFRNTLAFEYIAAQILPSVVSEKMSMNDNSLRVWSAGCSNGEEVYSFAIVIYELIKTEGIELNPYIFATDIDHKALKKAKDAIYSIENIKNVKYSLLKEYFTKDGELYKLKPKIKEIVNFSIYDLLDKKTYVPAESIFGTFDFVFCRNVLIYFQKEYQDKIFEKLYRSLAENGFLILGETEVPSQAYKRYFKKTNECCHIYQKIQL